jgi:hypothetical protein
MKLKKLLKIYKGFVERYRFNQKYIKELLGGKNLTNK